MDLTLSRSNYTPEGIFGILTDSDGNRIACTLEHAYPDGDSWVPKVAPGTYTCVRYDSPNHGYQVFTLKDVPPFQGAKVSYIEIHIGNYNHDSKGCILVGEERVGDMITNSRKTFETFMALQDGLDQFTLTVLE